MVSMATPHFWLLRLELRAKPLHKGCNRNAAAFVAVEPSRPNQRIEEMSGEEGIFLFCFFLFLPPHQSFLLWDKQRVGMWHQHFSCLKKMCLLASFKKILLLKMDYCYN